MGSINFRDALATAIDVSSPLPDGKYHVQLTLAELRPSNDGAKVQFKLNFKVLTGEHANRGCSKLITVSPESQKAMGIFFKEMEVLGIPKAAFEAGTVGDEEDIVRILNERQTQLLITTDEAKAYNKDYTNVQYMNALPSGPVATAPVAAAQPQPAPVAAPAVPPAQPAPPVGVAPPPVAPPPQAPFEQ